ncbi:NUDIX hydrolase [Candidatus Woesearchaeota archaeon]|jgi:mutator protein MutT|nr:NUDIX hydrolase [Candidatus Woesearchaeota archaeon]MBT6520080.1 NUDIX hydrolase [Candidatus Woesearchaeota archaeon]MBT7366685.1 NUDIX hydrolase [Candidatus Woesearchaeota archaeon]
MIKVAKAVILDCEKVLLIKRSASSKFFSSMWDFPGGKVKNCEDSGLCVVRETHEETALKIVSSSLILEGEVNLDSESINYSLFLVSEYKGGTIMLSEDHTEYGWFDREEIESLDVTPFVEKYFEKS